MKYVQQGDCIVIPVSSAVEGRRTSDSQTEAKILAFGELTGHTHRIVDPENACSVYKILDKLYVETLKPVTLRHEEHAPIVIAPGLHEVRIVVEADHLAGVVRQVAD